MHWKGKTCESNKKPLNAVSFFTIKLLNAGIVQKKV